MVEDGIVLSGWQLLAFAALAVVGMLIGIFRIDELLARRKSGPGAAKRPMGSDRSGRILLSDPDGKPWKRRGK